MWDGPAWIEIRNRLVVENLEWAHGIAAKIARKLPTWFSESDMMGAAEIALIKLSDQYRGYQDVPFRAFAIQRLRGACYDAIRRKEYKERGHRSINDVYYSDWRDGSRYPTHKTEVGLQMALKDPAPNPETLAQLSEMKGIWAHVHKLPGQYSRVICLIYGDELTQAEVARRVGMSEPWVSLAHGKALGMLREMVGR